ncbi:MAG: alpha/beta hydrolase, partial [Hyphomicrobiales bacterium]
MDILIKPVLWITLIYAGVCLVMYLAQRKLQYFPDTRHTAPSKYGLNTISDIELTTSDGETVRGWFAKPSDETKPLIFYFQGNAEAIQSRWERAKLFTDEGYGIFMLSYRGYGGSTGTPTEKGLMLDAKAAYEFLRAQGLSDAQLIYWGESLGSGIATQLATKHHPRAVVLEAPFTSAADVARRSYWFLPVGLL